MNFDFNNFMEAAPYLLLVYIFLKDKKLFVTPTEISELKQKIMQEVSEKFLSMMVFKQFEKNVESNFKNVEQRLEEGTKRFDKVDSTLLHIVGLIEEKRNHE